MNCYLCLPFVSKVQLPFGVTFIPFSTAYVLLILYLIFMLIEILEKNALEFLLYHVSFWSEKSSVTKIPSLHRLLGKCPGKPGSRGTRGSFLFCELWMWALLTFCLFQIRTAWWANIASVFISWKYTVNQHLYLP